jgi:phosphomannomutase
MPCPMAQLDEALLARARAWMDDDPDASDRAELEALLAAESRDEVHDRFRASLEFGTAGLRGLLGAGPNRMNLAVVLRATAGLVAYVKRMVPDAAERGVAIGFDGRRRSREFATAAAEVVNAAGLRALVFTDVVPTPLVGFACRDRHAAAGIVITASHNPPLYNGYKVFWENAAQIVPPHDEGIARSIDAIESAKAIARLSAKDAGALRVELGDEIAARYLDGVEALLVEPPRPRSLRIAYTALHGVGDRLARRAFARAGFENVHSVKEQAEPDGNFPTVAFPNPEEKGAMDLVLALAREKNAELVIANDPDADRLAVGARNRAGELVVLNGNEIGCLLAHHLLQHRTNRPSKGRVVLNTVVSSPMLGAIAEQHGARHVQTLTGFKWIANKSLELEAEGYEVVLGYEEALGYSVKGLVRDKDGVSAAAVMAELAALLADRGKTVLDELELMARRYGLFASRQISLVLPGEEGAGRIAAMMQRLREAPPSSIGPFAVIATTDFAVKTRTSAGKTEPIELPPSDVLLYELDGGHRVMARPSGTEPKIKFYVDVRIAMSEGEALAAANLRGKTLLDALGEAFVAYANPT